MCHRRPIRTSIAVAVALALSACGSDADDADDAPPADAIDQADQEATEAEAEPEPDAEPDSASTQEPGNVVGSETVTVTDMTGEVTVPVTADGVLALDEYAAIALLTLGITPETTAQFYDDFYDAGENAVIAASGTTYIPTDNLEALADADPNLMVGIGHPQYEPVIAEHRAIAPTIYPAFTSRWNEQTAVFAAVTGTSERADAVAAAIEERTAEVRQVIDDNGFTGAEVSLLQTFPGEFYAYNQTPLGGSILGDLGFTRPDFQLQDDAFGFLQFSEEELPSQTRSDIVIWIGASGSEDLFDNPLVVLDDRIGVEVNGLWTSNHALGAWVMLDDIERTVTGQPPVSPGDEVVELWEDLLDAIDAATDQG